MSEELQPRRGRPPLNREPEQSLNDSDANARRKTTRVPFSSTRQKLAWAPRSGYHRHWFNDEPGRVQQALEAGYEHVPDRDGKHVSRNVGVAEGGGALKAFLMEIPEEWYQEDMAREQQLIKDKEDAMKRGQTGADLEKGYVPSQGISIR